MHPRRVALYSPGMIGLGHMRRNLLVAQALAAAKTATTILLIAEAREASALPMPAGVDCVTLPALRKEDDGSCRPRHLNLSAEDTVSLRSTIIHATLSAFDPDLLIVDHLPMGAAGELAPALANLTSHGRTRCVLGLRDILESPAVVRKEWALRRYGEAIAAYYHAVWVYGDPAVYNPVAEYGLPDAVARKLRFVGYLDSRARLECGRERNDVLDALGPASDRFVLCLVGGGSDGAALAEAFADAPLPADTSAVVITGPFMPSDARERLYRRASERRTLRVLDFVSEPAVLVSRASRLVTMGGYNNVLDVVAFEKPGLVVPRTWPRCEQLIRATRLRELGLLDVLLPHELTSAAIGGWMQEPVQSRAGIRNRVDLEGLARVPALADDVLGTTAGSVAIGADTQDETTVAVDWRRTAAN